MIPGIKVDLGAKPLAGHPGETVTEGLDGLRQRLEEYAELGARFTKWRGVYRIGDAPLSPGCFTAHAHDLARSAAPAPAAALLPHAAPATPLECRPQLELSQTVPQGVAPP